MWAKWLGPSSLATALAAATSVTAVAVVAWMVARRRTTRQPAYLELGVLMLLVPLLSPQGWDYVLIVATPVYMCLIDRFGAMSRSLKLVTGTGIFLTSFTVFDLLHRTIYTAAMAYSVVTIGALLLLAAAAALRANHSA
jgi:hypothetical protein